MTFRELQKQKQNRRNEREKRFLEAIAAALLLLSQSAFPAFDVERADLLGLKGQGTELTSDIIRSRPSYAEAVDELRSAYVTFNASASSEIASFRHDFYGYAVDDYKTYIYEGLKLRSRRPSKIPNNFFGATVAEPEPRFDYDERLLNFEDEILLQIEDRFLESLLSETNDDSFLNFLSLPSLRAEQTGVSESYDLYTDVGLETMSRSRAVEAWRWRAVLDERTCPVCIYLDGQIFPFTTEFFSHVSCRCTPEPVFYSFDEMGLNPDDELVFEDDPEDSDLRGVEWFDSLPEQTQRRILGPGKYRYLETGQLNFSDFVREFDHPQFGKVREEASLKYLRNQGRI